jgi:hypothetical protein
MSTKVKSKLKPNKPAFKKAPNVPQDASAIKKAKQKVMDDNMNTRVGRVLRANMESFEFDKYHVPFASRFLKNLVSEQDEIEITKTTPSQNAGEAPTQKSPDEFTPEGDKEEFNKSLEQNTPEDEFDTMGVSPDVTSDTLEKIKDWSKKLDDFASFLNDPSSESLHYILSKGDRSGSLLRGVTRKASDSITRIAGEVEKLKEILNTYIITAPKKLRDVQSQMAGGQGAGWTQY